MFPVNESRLFSETLQLRNRGIPIVAIHAWSDNANGATLPAAYPAATLRSTLQQHQCPIFDDSFIQICTFQMIK